MTSTEKRLVRLAVAVHQELLADQVTRFELPLDTWQQLEYTTRKMRRAECEGFSLATQSLQANLQSWVQRLQEELRQIDLGNLREHRDSQQATAGDICADLRVLEEEFEEVSFDYRSREIAVTTEPIELDGIFLGPFEIRLDCRSLGECSTCPYRVIALDPNPADCNDSVTHPHVQDEYVCEGEARVPIRTALAEGRLLDFFLLVANLLRNYNPSSPYVALVDWYGVTCTDCGATVSWEDRYSCEKCETWLCQKCTFYCESCEGIYCNECVAPCAECEDYSCNSCLDNCPGCQADLCRRCLDNNERCKDCHEKTQREEDQSGGPEETQPSTDPALQPHRLGQIAISA